MQADHDLWHAERKGRPNIVPVKQAGWQRNQNGIGILFSKGVTATYTTAVNFCMAALHVSRIAAGLNPGDEGIRSRSLKPQPGAGG